MGLISPRFFECMGSGTLVFCESSNLYRNIFPDDTYVSFNPDLSDFTEKFMFYLDDDEERNKIINKAYDFVSKNHTWELRIKDLLSLIKKDLKNV